MMIEFLIPTFDRQAPLVSMLASLLAQTNPNWIASVIIDNTEEMPAEKIVKNFNDQRITCYYTDRRYGDWGHSLREQWKNKSTADYVIGTCDDNYYIPICVNEIITTSEKYDNPGFIYWDMVHSHYDYSFFRCNPFYNQIDMGAFATRTDIAKQIRINTSYAADGEFVNEFNQRFGNEKKVKINKVLFVHN